VALIGESCRQHGVGAGEPVVERRLENVRVEAGEEYTLPSIRPKIRPRWSIAGSAAINLAAV
jgi:hypothetical protein